MSRLAPLAVVVSAVILGCATGGLLVWLATMKDARKARSSNRSFINTSSNPSAYASDRGLTASRAVVFRDEGEREPLPMQLKSPGEENAVFFLDEELDTENIRLKHAQLFEHHEADARDVLWAASSERSLTEIFSSVQGTHRLTGLECRMSSCVASLEWPSYQEAVTGYQSILQTPLVPNCSISIIIEPSQDGQVSQQRAFLDCVDARSENSD